MIRSCRGFTLLKDFLEFSKEILAKIDFAVVIIPSKRVVCPIAS